MEQLENHLNGNKKNEKETEKPEIIDLSKLKEGQVLSEDVIKQILFLIEGTDIKFEDVIVIDRNNVEEYLRMTKEHNERQKKT